MARTTSKAVPLDDEPKSKQPAKKHTGQLNKFDEDLAKFAQEQQEQERNSGGGLPFISCRGAEFSFGGNVIGDTINVIILNYVKENCYYDQDYDSDNPVAPACFAFGTKEADMKPHENVLNPQCASCAKCWANEFSSADKGKGKACKNVRRLQLVLEESLDDVENADVVYLKTPVMSVKGFSTFVQQVTQSMKLPTFAVLAEISLHPDKKSQFKQSFKVIEKIEDQEVIGALIKLRENHAEALVTPYAVSETEEEDDQPKARGGKKPAPKAKYRHPEPDDEKPSQRKGRKF